MADEADAYDARKASPKERVMMAEILDIFHEVQQELLAETEEEQRIAIREISRRRVQAEQKRADERRIEEIMPRYKYLHQVFTQNGLTPRQKRDIHVEMRDFALEIAAITRRNKNDHEQLTDRVVQSFLDGAEQYNTFIRLHDEKYGF
jgi:hypothetical protein